MSYTNKCFLDLLTNKEYQKIILEKIPYGQQHEFEPYEVLYKLINKDKILFNWSDPLKDNQPAIDCVDITTSPYTLIQIKNKQTNINEVAIIGYMKEYVLNNPQLYQQKEYLYKVEICDDQKYDALLAEFKQRYLKDFSIQLRPYQQAFIDHHKLELLNSHISVVNCFCRFGKSYLMKYLQELFNWRICVITTKPTETGDQFKALNLDFVSIQYLKVNNLTPDKNLDALFIDEAQEQFMTDLTEGLINLDDYKHIIFFTGTSEVLLEYLYYWRPYYCHYNFGDYLSHPLNEFKFPSIKFELNKEPKYESDGFIHLIFNRNLNTQQALTLGAEKGWQVQTSQNESDILASSASGVYLCIEQFTTGVTLERCTSVEIQNTQFTETDIQEIFRCWNPNYIDIERHIYFSDIGVMQKCLEYIFRQTGEQYVSISRIKELFGDLVSQEDLAKMSFKQMEINIQSPVLKSLKKQLLIIDINIIIKKDLQKSLNTIQNLLDKIQDENNIQLTLTQNEQFVQEQVKQTIQKGVISDEFLVLIQRLISQLAFNTLQFTPAENEFNRDFSAMSLFAQLLNQKNEDLLLGLKQLMDNFNAQREVSSQTTYKKQLYLIFDTYDKAINSRIIKYIRQLIQHSTPFERYSLLTPYFQTTSLERKKNAEILTPNWVANEMIDKLVAIYGIEQLSQWKIIEPCCGKGVFLINLYKRLQEYYLKQGLSQEESHSASIERLYWNDFNQSNTEFCNILFNSNKGTCKDALQENYQNYDLVITNPPYSTKKQNSSNSKNTQTVQIYQKFMNLGKLCMTLTPYKWTQQQTFKKFRETVLNKLIYIKNIGEPFGKPLKGAQGHFVAVSTGQISYQIISQNEVQTPFIIQGDEIQQNNILTKYKRIDGEYFIHRSIKDQLKDQLKETFKKDQLEEYIKVLCVKNQYQYISQNVIHHKESVNKYKVIFPNIFSKSSQFQILSPGVVFNSSYAGFFCDSLEESQNLIQCLESQRDVINRNLLTPHLTNAILEKLHKPNILNRYKRIDGRFFIKEEYQLTLTKQNTFKENQFENSIQCFVSKQLYKSQLAYVDEKIISNKEFINKYKVIFPNIFSKSSQFQILSPGVVFNSSYAGFFCDSFEEAQSLIQCLESQKDVINRNLLTPHFTNAILEKIYL